MGASPWMTISSGFRLGRYEIIAPLGAGGMGEVYRARDTRLDRDVAIKFLPEAFSRDADRLARFEREAKTLASLNDPHIAQIHGVEDSPSADSAGGHVRALVMEYVGGETLAERLARGPIAVDETLSIAKQIAEGLSAAHEHGIIHRDLKPSNVKITDDGKVKVLDFGLAKATLGEDPLSGAFSDSPTFTTPMNTRMGVILGTAAYMSPEQARGRQLDRRADIWAFGCVVYEMLTGRTAFGEATVTDTLAAIVTRDPDWNALPPAVPANLQWVLRHSLQRDTKRRLHDIADAAIALDDAVAISGKPSATQPVIVRRRGVPLWAAALAVVAAALAGALARPDDEPNTPLPLRQFHIQAPYLVADAQHRPVISPDGRRIAWSADGTLWLREMDRGETRALAKDVDPTYLSWSPDSDAIMFVSQNQLMRVAAIGGGLMRISDMKFRRSNTTPGGAWLTDGQFVFASAFTNTGVETVPAHGGAFRTLFPPPPGVKDFHSPSTIPDGGFLLVVDRTAEGTDRVAAYKDGRLHEVFVLPGERLEGPVYAPSGHLLYERQGGSRGVWAVKFSLDTLKTDGEHVRIDPHGAWPSVAADGTLVYTKGDSGSPLELAVVTSPGAAPRAIGPPLIGASSPRVSPDGRKIVVSGRDDVGSLDLYVVDMTTGTRTRLTSAQDAVAPRWAPGNRVLFVNHGGRRPDGDICIVSADGSGTVRTLVEHAYDPVLSPDHQWLIFNRPSAATGSDIYRLRVDPATMTPAAGAKEEVLVNSIYNERFAQVDRSGSFLAYEAETTGRRELYLTTFPQAGETRQVSRTGVEYSMWDPAADRLLFVQSGRLYEVPVKLRPSVSVGQPRELFDERPTRIVLSQFADLTPDGRGFVAVQRPPLSEAPLGMIVVIENWFQLFGEPRRQ